MKIHSLFVPEDALDGSNIDVDTVKGVVTLSGTVATEAGRARALAIAKSTDGAKSVVDKLRIGPAERELDDVVRDAGQATSPPLRKLPRTPRRPPGLRAARSPMAGSSPRSTRSTSPRARSRTATSTLVWSTAS